MTKAELEKKHLAELHALAADAGVERYRMLPRTELIAKLADAGSGSGGGSGRADRSAGRADRSAGSADREESPRRERPPRRRRSGQRDRAARSDASASSESGAEAAEAPGPRRRVFVPSPPSPPPSLRPPR
jgi:hypothetical protein